MTEEKRCPKCGGEVEIGRLRAAPHWLKGTGVVAFSTGSRAFAHKCRDCGYIELGD